MNCNHIVADDYLFCPYCGTQQTRKICVCQRVNAEDAEFCTRCGGQLDLAKAGAAKSIPIPGCYDLDEMLTAIKNDPSVVPVSTNDKISQQEISRLFNRKKTNENK